EIVVALEALGGPSLRLLGQRERDWDESNASALLQPLMDAATIVYAPSRIDFHPDHLLAARVVAALVRPGQIVRIMELGVPLTSRLVNLVADVSSVLSAKERALAAFATQRATILILGRLARYRAHRFGHTNVEVFWEMGGASYRRLMAGNTNGAVFRGIRARPFLDPLCWLLGRSERGRLLRVATQ
ncbi:MAG: PIG-L deacetylase family protein, partial [Longimicrobiales bacterium]